jgi:hypothetical protein
MIYSVVKKMVDYPISEISGYYFSLYGQLVYKAYSRP